MISPFKTEMKIGVYSIVNLTIATGVRQIDQKDQRVEDNEPHRRWQVPKMNASQMT